MTQATITTERLTLRAPTQADADCVALLARDLNVSRWLTHVPHPYGRDDALTWINAMVARDDPTLLICRDGTVIGSIGLRSELGYWIGADFWGQGFATEAARALLTRHFAASDNAVSSGYHLGNERSAHVLRKLGFVPTHLEQAHVAATAEVVQVQKMRLTGAGWRHLS